MADFKISRIRYTWRNAWANATVYNRDDVVKYGGSTWVCQRQHTASLFAADQNFTVGVDPRPAWFKMTDGYAWRDAWATATLYNPGDLALYGGVIYLCVTSHTSLATFDASISNWAEYLSADNWRTSWLPATRYGIGDVVRYNGAVYRCVVGHTSSSTALGLEVGNNDTQDDSTGELWQKIYEGIEYRGLWTASTRYRENDLVKISGSVFRCTVPHTSTSLINYNNFTVIINGYKFYQTWSAGVYYAPGDMVRHGGNVYLANAGNIGLTPAADNNSVWNLLSKAVNFSGTWSSTTNYKIGDLVTRGGNLYLANSDTNSDGSSLDYLDAGDWELVNVGQRFTGEWALGQSYDINDLVVYLGTTYACNVYHAATNQNFPGDNGSGFFYWDVVLEAASPGSMTAQGDILTFDLSNTLVGDNSTFGTARLAIGSAGQLLSVNDQSSVIYKTVGLVARTVYVTTDGVDDVIDPLRGYSPFAPWRTVRFACQQVNDGYSGHTTIKVDAGIFEEVTPIVVPQKTVILGSELRSTTIQASPSILSTTDRPYHISMLTRLSSVLANILANTSPSSVTAGNTVLPTLGLAAVNTTITAIQLKITQIQNYINYYIANTGSAPAITGSNTAETDVGITNAAIILESNKLFLQAEAVAYLQSAFPAYTFNSSLVRLFVLEYVNALKYDIVYTGNHRSLLAAKYYRNSVLGCTTTEDMFYVRNATGIRDCTLKGIVSQLNAIGVDPYQKPAGGSYVSLDPGWGPGDVNSWITTRSPYIQGVTTIGTGCVGVKVDGNLHSGGNRSITANDFTQVLSDGIGAWVSNNGRAELVSVFTYYAHVGYLAEDGGIIRATNGNCSYGDFGVISDGVDATETPQLASIYTKSEQAVVSSAFAGEFVDEIQILEFSNFGEDYTTATVSFAGAGIDASAVFEEFRDDAVYAVRILDANTTGAQSLGGSGYVVRQNNAQSGTNTTITIAANDQGTYATYAGMRIIIISGEGTGQYGYVGAYDDIGKVVSVYRETDNQPGWDHVVPGKLPSLQLLSNTIYRIEPRVIFSEPQFVSQSVTTPASAAWNEITYGETTKTYTNVAVNQAGTGTAAVSPVFATFNVNKIGRNYTISINTSGTRYQVGQVLTISGNLVGGSTPINDISIEVMSVSSNGSQNILTAVQKTYGSGIRNRAASGVFVAVSSTSATVYSPDGETWTGASMPSAGIWKCLAAGKITYPTPGNHIFVAIRKTSSVAASSLDGVTWTTQSMPASREWNSCIYGGGVFLAVATDSNSAAYSLNGTSWTTVSLPAGDSTLNQWVDVAYGKNTYVALANSGNNVATGSYNSTLNTWSWQIQIMDSVADSSQKDWVSIVYGNNRFVAISSTGDVSYSFDGLLWLASTMPSQDGSTSHNWKKIRYGQGVFFAVGDLGGRDVGGDSTVEEPQTNFAATSFDGITWTARTLSSSAEWTTVAFGNPFIDSLDSTAGRNSPIWVTIDNTQQVNKIKTGARALGRPVIGSGRISAIRLWDPGSGYQDSATITLVDPNNNNDVLTECLQADGVLAQPSWLNRGLGYRTATTISTIIGDGYADIRPIGKFIVIDDLTSYPRPGANLTIGTVANTFTVTTIEPLGITDRGLAARIRVTPEIKTRDNLQHLTQVVVRSRFSQARITGHDFLDIGTGNFLETNYPTLYSGFYTVSPENEVVELNRGRVFYTSTDQDGNFRAGELFTVEQSRGIVSVSADFFDFSGLTELSLGGIQIGGSAVIVREFSTDPLFTADSNNIVPTQRAVSAYLANRLSVGGASIAVGSFIAGTVLVGPARIQNTAGLTIRFTTGVDFRGSQAAIRGSILAQTLFHTA